MPYVRGVRLCSLYGWDSEVNSWQACVSMRMHMCQQPNIGRGEEGPQLEFHENTNLCIGLISHVQRYKANLGVKCKQATGEVVQSLKTKCGVGCRPIIVGSNENHPCGNSCGAGQRAGLGACFFFSWRSAQVQRPRQRMQVPSPCKPGCKFSSPSNIHTAQMCRDAIQDSMLGRPGRRVSN